jgi:hypothetical protein
MPEREIVSPPALLPRIPLARIEAVVSAHLGPARVDNKQQPAVFNRQIAMYLAKHIGGWSTTVIGRFYNGRDHSTVCYSIQRIKSMREISRKVDQLVANLEKVLQSPDDPGLADDPSIKRPASIRLDKLREDILLERLADRIASRLAQLLGRVEISGAPFLAGENAATEARALSDLEAHKSAPANA